jgi:predicted RNase H-like HicB family nuclease
VFAAGETHEELVECLSEAIELYLEETGIPPELEQRVEIQTFSLTGDRLIPA